MHSIPNIPDYRINADDFLGEGAYGCVWRAVFKGDQERAVKVFKPRAIQEMLFEGEYDKLRQLDEHPGIITLYDRGRTQANEPYFVMRLLAEKQGERWVGRTLASRLADQGLEAPDKAMRWRWTRQIAEAVAFMHGRDIVHCDLKPSNVLLGSAENPDAVVSDFGQSRSSSLRELPAPGSLAFASPEQLENPERSNPRWDVYGFASTAYYLWQGGPPRPLSDEAGAELDADELVTLTEALEPDEQLARLIAQVREQDEIVAVKDGGDMPPDLLALLQRCLSLDPEDRPADMVEVLAELREIEARSRRGVPKWLMATLGVAVVAAIAIGVVYAGKVREQQALIREQQRLEQIEAAKEDLREQLESAAEADDHRARHEIAVRLLEYEPDNAELLVARFESLAGIGHWERLREALKDAPEAVVARPDLLPVHARLAIQSDDQAKATMLWAELAGITTVDSKLRQLGFREWCLALKEAKNWSRLNDAASDWLAWEPGIDAYLFRVRALLNLREFARARSDLDAARDLDATDDRVRTMTPLVERGELLAQQLVGLDAAVAADRRDPEPLFDRALACVQAGFPGLASGDLEAAKRLAPASMAVRVLQEIVLYIEHSRRVEDSPVNIDGNRWSTYDQQHLESIEKDAPLLGDLLAMEIEQAASVPDDADIGTRARKLTALGQNRLAIELAKPPAMRESATLNVWFPLLAAYFQGQFWSEGEAMAEQATRRFGYANGSWFFLGVFRARQNDHRGAVDAFSKALEIVEDLNALDWRATSYDALGQSDLAAQDRARRQQLQQPNPRPN